MYLPHIEYLAPSTTDELVELLDLHREKARMLAGGTDLVINLAERSISADYLVYLGGIKNLDRIDTEQGRGTVIGALTTMEAIEGSSHIRKNYYALHQAAAEVGGPQIRSMATIGGNLCNASPAADTPPALAALGAKVALVGKGGRREMPVEAFIQGNRKIALEPGEFLESVLLPEPVPHSASRFDLITLRKTLEIDAACLSVLLVLDPTSGAVTDVRIAMGAVAPVPLRARKAEQLLTGQTLDDVRIDKAAAACAAEATPIDDIRGSADYRREVIRVMASRTLKQTAAELK